MDGYLVILVVCGLGMLAGLFGVWRRSLRRYASSGNQVDYPRDDVLSQATTHQLYGKLPHVDALGSSLARAEAPQWHDICAGQVEIDFYSSWASALPDQKVSEAYLSTLRYYQERLSRAREEFRTGDLRRQFLESRARTKDLLQSAHQLPIPSPPTFAPFDREE